MAIGAAVCEPTEPTPGPAGTDPTFAAFFHGEPRRVQTVIRNHEIKSFSQLAKLGPEDF